VPEDKPSVPPKIGVGGPAIADEETSVGTGVEAAAADKVTCPECSHENPKGNRFCASCGHRLDQPKPEAPRPAPAAPAAGSVSLTALSPDGVEAGTFALSSGENVVGRESGGVFGGDNYLSPKHAALTPTGDGLMVRDAGSLNGVFRKLNAEQRCPLEPGQIFRIGQELIQFQALDPEGPDADGVEHMGAPIKGYVGRIAMVLGRETVGTTFPVPETGLSLGRERGEVLFSDDGYVSGLHCRLSYEEGKVYITDLGSSNGTFVRILKEEKVGNGDILLMGQQLFRVSL
jgi:pSer/pThr/pTyr-binding forkhead associated (FHA) protein